MLRQRRPQWLSLMCIGVACKTELNINALFAKLEILIIIFHK